MLLALNDHWWIGSDNMIRVPRLREATTGTIINDADITAQMFESDGTTEVGDEIELEYVEGSDGDYLGKFPSADAAELTADATYILEITITIRTPREVSAIAVSNAGSGYVEAPTITVAAPAPSSGWARATATAVLDGDTIDTITVNTGGAKYRSAPAITVTAAEDDPGTGGAATATIGTMDSVTVERISKTAKYLFEAEHPS